MGTRIAHGRPCGLLHDLADLARQGEFAPALHQNRLDRHHVAAVFVDGHPGDGTDLVFGPSGLGSPTLVISELSVGGA